MSHPINDLQRFVDRLSARSLLSDEEKDAVLALPGELRHYKAKYDIVGVREKTKHCCLITAGIAAVSE